MPELPKTLQVGPLRYRVEADAEKIKAHRLTRGASDWAYAWHNKLEIVVDPELAAGQQAEYLMHEVLHALLRTSGLGAYLDEHEPFVSKLSPWLLDLLKRNPALVAYLTEDAD